MSAGPNVSRVTQHRSVIATWRLDQFERGQSVRGYHLVFDEFAAMASAAIALVTKRSTFLKARQYWITLGRKPTTVGRTFEQGVYPRAFASDRVIGILLRRR